MVYEIRYRVPRIIGVNNSFAIGPVYSRPTTLDVYTINECVSRLKNTVESTDRKSDCFVGRGNNHCFRVSHSEKKDRFYSLFTVNVRTRINSSLIILLSVQARTLTANNRITSVTVHTMTFQQYFHNNE